MIRKQWYIFWHIRLRWWLWENRPVQCADCRRIVRRKNAHMEIHNAAGMMWFCGDCDRRLHLYDGRHR